jgi:hypothetical protein
MPNTAVAKIRWVICHYCGQEHVVDSEGRYVCKEPHYIVEGDEVFEGNLRDLRRDNGLG